MRIDYKINGINIAFRVSASLPEVDAYLVRHMTCDDQDDFTSIVYKDVGLKTLREAYQLQTGQLNSSGRIIGTKKKGVIDTGNLLLARSYAGRTKILLQSVRENISCNDEFSNVQASVDNAMKVVSSLKLKSFAMTVLGFETTLPQLTPRQSMRAMLSAIHSFSNKREDLTVYIQSTRLPYDIYDAGGNSATQAFRFVTNDKSYIGCKDQIGVLRLSKQDQLAVTSEVFDNMSPPELRCQHLASSDEMSRPLPQQSYRPQYQKN